MSTCCELAAPGFRSGGPAIHQRRAATEQKIVTVREVELQVGAPTFKVSLEVRLDNFFRAIFPDGNALEVSA